MYLIKVDVVERMVFIRMMLGWNAIDNWMRDRRSSELCKDSLNTYISLNHGIEK